MFSYLFRRAAFVFLVLLIGQIPIQKREIGKHVLLGVQGIGDWGRKQVTDSKLYQDLSKKPWVAKWVTQIKPPREIPKAMRAIQAEVIAPAEEIVEESLENAGQKAGEAAGEAETMLRLLDKSQ